MITIALDEFGDFENASQTHEPIMIGGLLYDDRDDTYDEKNERERIQKYYQRVCEDANTTYPVDIHGNGTNKKREKATKQKICSTITEFIKNGTYQGEEFGIGPNQSTIKRKGKYYFFVLLKSEVGYKELYGAKTSTLVNEQVAGNLYIHMAEDVVSKLIFHNPVIPNVKHVHLNLPTRVAIIKNDEKQSQKFKEYQDLGYSKQKIKVNGQEIEVQNADGKISIALINEHIYRTAVEREMIERGRSDIQIDHISTKSIGYKHGNDWKLSFLYLADSFCAHIKESLKEVPRNNWLEKAREAAKEWNHTEKNVIWGYDEIESYFRRAWIKVEEKDYFEALSLIWEGLQIESEMKDYYEKYWKPLFLTHLAKEKDCSAYILALQKLRPMILRNSLKQEKLLFVFHELEKMSAMLDDKYHQEIFYELYDVGVTAYTHIGDSDTAKHYFEKCKNYADHVGTEVYLATCNKVVVFLCDYFKFDEALSYADENITYFEEINKVREKMFPKRTNEYYPGLAKAYSQLGQVLSYLRDASAEDYFKEALKGYEAGSANYNITLSFLMHFYIEMGEEYKEKFIQASIEYFQGNKELEKQFAYLVKEGAKGREALISLKFALFVFLKGIYRFRLKDISKKLKTKLLDIEQAMKEIDVLSLNEMNGHPWELIYKYLAFIMLELGNTSVAETYMKKSREVLKEKGFTIERLIQFGELEYQMKCGKTAIQETEDYQELEKIITYMYR